MKKQNNDDNLFFKVLNVLKLETTTSHGRINLAFIIILSFFCILYTANDTISYLVSAVSDTVKTLILNKDISHPYESNNLLSVFLPILILTVFCLIYLHIHEKAKIQNPYHIENDPNNANNSDQPENSSQKPSQ